MRIQAKSRTAGNTGKRKQNLCARKSLLARSHRNGSAKQHINQYFVTPLPPPFFSDNMKRTFSAMTRYSSGVFASSIDVIMLSGMLLRQDFDGTTLR
jgi:hypothetical protein